MSIRYCWVGVPHRNCTKNVIRPVEIEGVCVMVPKRKYNCLNKSTECTQGTDLIPSPHFILLKKTFFALTF